MAVLPVGIGPVSGYQIQRSLRFNSADSAYLNKTLTTPTNNKIWTWSGWVKRTSFGTNQVLIGTTDNNTASGNVGALRFTTSNTLEYFEYSSGYTLDLITTQVFRDPSAWYHIVLAVDTTQATSSNRVKFYINGSQINNFNTATYPPINQTLYINSATATYQGAYNNSGTGILSYFNGYLTEINFIDGQALTPSSFGQTNANTGVWEPIKYTGTYGTNGFYLNFSDNSNTTSTTLGKDSSGNGNNWTPNNFSVTAGAGNDSLVDTPTSYGSDTGVGGEVRGNYATLNPLIVIPRGTISNGNLNYLSGSTSSHGSAAASFTLPTTGKWYWEVTACNNSGGSGNNEAIGIANIQNNPQLPAAGSEVGSRTGDYIYRSSGVRISGGSSVSYGATYTNGDVIGVAWDSDAGTLVFYKNGVSQGTAYSSITQVEGRFAPASTNAETSNGDNYNFGQRPFAYTAPSGFKALCTQNLPPVTIGATSTTQAGKYFDTALYTGNGNIRSVTGLGFQPDLVWIKCRSVARDNKLTDAVRGTTNALVSNSTAAATTDSNGLATFNTDGFTVYSDATYNTNGNTYVAWNWNGGGSNATNTSGTITSTVRANTTAGFSIVTYTGNSNLGALVGHGLGQTPAMIIIKNRGAAQNWLVYHRNSNASPATGALFLDATNGFSVSNTYWYDIQPSDAVFALGGSALGNAAANTYVAYCFAPVAGYSTFGSYTGNGSTDGPFVYTGFRPRYIMIKRTDSANDWLIIDTSRNPYNVTNLNLWANLSTAEGTADRTDVLSNGFKLRNSLAEHNASGGTYIYAAFAESPFKYALAR